jgi:hypothetical protein
MDVYVTIEARDFSQDLVASCRYDDPRRSQVEHYIEDLITATLEEKGRSLPMDPENFFAMAYDGDLGAELSEMLENLLFRLHYDHFGWLPKARVMSVSYHLPRVNENPEAQKIVRSVVQEVNSRFAGDLYLDEFIEHLEKKLESAGIEWVDVTYDLPAWTRESNLVNSIVNVIPKALGKAVAKKFA